MSGSPNYSKERIFTITICFQSKSADHAESIFKTYRNPIILAKGYAEMIKTGQCRTQSDVAKMLGVNRSRINQFINLLKLDFQVINDIENLGDSLPSRIVTERMLRPYLHKSHFAQQRDWRVYKTVNYISE